MGQFSPDRPDPPTRFRPSTGQIGQAAALKGIGRGGGSGGKRSRPSPERRKSEGQGQGPSSRLGLPQLPQQEGDNRHLLPALHHANIQDLGRDIPFGLWAIHNGYFPEIAGKGMVPFDWIEDGG